MEMSWTHMLSLQRFEDLINLSGFQQRPQADFLDTCNPP
jgi:hypothetical protein